MKYDIAAKVVIEKGKEAILRRFLKMDPSNIEMIEQLPEETTSLRRSDFPLLVTLKDGQEIIVLIEIQTDFDSDFPLRLIEYSVRFMLKYHTDVIPFVLVLKKTNLATGIYENNILTFKYRAFRFWEEDPKNYLDEISIYPFLPLMKDDENVLGVIDRKIADSTDIGIDEKSDLLTSMAIFAGFKNRDLAIELIKRRRDIMMESPTYEILREEFGKEALQEGMQKGLQQGLREALIDVLEFKFDVIPDELVKKINDISNADILNSLHRRAMECNSIEEFEDRMEFMLRS